MTIIAIVVTILCLWVLVLTLMVFGLEMQLEALMAERDKVREWWERVNEK